MEWHRVKDAHIWDRALAKLPAAHVLQSWAWGDFKSRWGWLPERWLLGAPAEPRAAVQILKRRVGPLCVMYATKGPVARDAAAMAEALAHIEQRARSSRAIWVKVDADPHALEPAPDAAAMRALLAARGWAFSGQQIQFRNTGLTVLRDAAGQPISDDALLAAMHQKWRYNVRLAAKRGVNVRAAGPDEASALFDLYAETGKRDGFALRERAYYLDAWRALNTHTSRSHTLVAEHEGQLLAGMVLFAFGDRAWYFYGMSRSAGREHMPTYALQFAAMRWARDAGYAVYDWWGAPDDLANPADGMAGVWRWKEGFGARFMPGTGAWDYTPVPWLARMVARLRPVAA